MQNKFVLVVVTLLTITGVCTSAINSTNVVLAATSSVDTTLPKPLIISAVQTTGGTGKTNQDFIELYNPNPTPVNLNGYRLVKRTATGTTDSSIKTWTSDSIIPPFSFYLWVNSTFIEVTATPDITTTATIADNNGVAIRYGDADTGQLIDSLAWGTTTNSFTSTGLANPTAGQSIIRNDLLSTNPASYSISASNPRNSSTNLLPQFYDNSTCTITPATDTVEPNVPLNVNLDFTNAGNTTWTTANYTIVSSVGTNLSLPAELSVAPTQGWQTALDIISPLTDGNYTYQWQLSDNGVNFGQGCLYSLLVQTLPLQNPPADPPIDPPIAPLVTTTPVITSPPLPTTIKITELLPNPTGSDTGKEAVELYNYGSEPVYLENWTLDNVSVDQDINAKALVLGNIQLDSGQYLAVTIPAGKFVMNNTNGDVVTLFDDEDQPIDSVQYTTQAPAQKSYSLINGQWLWLEPSLGEENQLPVVIPPVVKSTEVAIPKTVAPKTVAPKTVAPKTVAPKATVTVSAAKKATTKPATKTTAKISTKPATKATAATTKPSTKSTAKATSTKNNTPTAQDQKPVSPLGAIAIALASLGAGGLALYRFGLGGLL